MNYFKQYYDKLNECFDKILEEETENIKKAGAYIADWLSRDRNNLLYIIGTGEHSTLAANELFKRAGGMPCVYPIFSQAAFYERVPGMIEKDFEKLDIPKGAPIIIASHVGMNTFTVETAEICRKRGLFLIGIEGSGVLAKLPETFAGFSKSKKVLHDYCDITIDHKTPFGDATLHVDGIDCPVGPVSNILIFSILHLIELAAYEEMGKKGFQPPIYISANIPGGDEHNRSFNEKYRNLVKFW